MTSNLFDNPVRGRSFLVRMESPVTNALLTINREWCKGCGICIAFCPREALFLDEMEKAVKDNQKCRACGVCEMFCPDFAISLIKQGRPDNAGDQTGPDAR
ncbi:MAG: 4Fe-4S binding protein [Bacillota bacterium]|jgi:2-oxoglutarate ferredoxin oxidoreductase subunit delta|nr:4Fe-4S binding protein [Bacillota bacterium]